MSVFLTKVGIFFLAEGSPAAEADVDGGIRRVVIPVLKGLESVHFVTERNKAIVIAGKERERK